MITNIIIGTPLVSLELLGVDDTEESVAVSMEEATNDKGEIFLPTILKNVGLFKSNNEIRQINDQRKASGKVTDPDQDLWRNITGPELTLFKIGKKVFWLIVGE